MIDGGPPDLSAVDTPPASDKCRVELHIVT